MTDVTRETRETCVRITLDLKGGGAGAVPAIATTEPFLDHMLATLARHAGWRLGVEAAGDLRHHLIEDVAIAAGRALAESAPAEARRYGDCTVAMDDALVQAVVDLGGRAYYRGPVPSRLYDHWLRSFSEHARMTLHVRVLRGRDRHHVVEAAFKGLGLALSAALAPGGAVFSTKGAVRWAVARSR